MNLFYFFAFFLTSHLLALPVSQAATITVTEKNDSSGGTICSLRNAVQSVNTVGDFGGCSHSGPDYGTDDTIILEAGTYTLSLPSTGEENNADGDIDIIRPLRIQGAGPDLTNVTGAFPAGQEDRIFHICPNVQCLTDTTVVLTGLAVSNGGANDFQGNGGGILITESFMPPGQVELSLQDCQVRDNHLDPTGFSGGGGITNDGADITIEGCQISGNQAFFGGGIESFNGFLAINESTIDNNDGIAGGGGISTGNAILLLYNSTVSNNRALGSSQIPGTGNGGGVSVAQVCNDRVTIVNSTISDNQAARGGGVLVNECIDDTGGAGGGPPFGVQIYNTTIAFNEAIQSNQGNGFGGGIHFVPNLVGTGEPTAPSVTLFNSILAQNQAPTGPDCFDLVQSGGFNLIGNTSDCNLDALTANPDQQNIDPRLDTLQDNGGPTQTIGLFEDSPAIDMGNNLPGEGCLAPDMASLVLGELPQDQRAFPRPIAVLDPNNPICDVGAFEFQTFGFALTKDDGLGGQSVPVGTNFDYTIVVTNNGPGTATSVTLNDPLPSQMNFLSVGSSQGACTGIGQVIDCDLGDLAEGASATVTVTVTPTVAGSFTNTVTLNLNDPSQLQLTQTAQAVTNVVGGTGLLIFGAGCNLQSGQSPATFGGLLAMGALGIGFFAAFFVWREKKSTR